MCLFTTGYASNAFANTVKEICENTSAMYTISGFFFLELQLSQLLQELRKANKGLI